MGSLDRRISRFSSHHHHYPGSCTTATGSLPLVPPKLSPQMPTPAALSSSELATPIRGGIGIMSCASTLRRTRTAPRHRPISDRETMRQLVGCIGLSVRKKVFAAGCTPRGSTPGPSMKLPITAPVQVVEHGTTMTRASWMGQPCLRWMSAARTKATARAQAQAMHHRALAQAPALVRRC